MKTRYLFVGIGLAGVAAPAIGNIAVGAEQAKKFLDLDCTPISRPLKQSDGPSLAVEIKEGQYFKADIFINASGQAKGAGHMDYYRDASGAKAIQYPIQSFSGSKFRISFVTYNVGFGPVIWNYIPDFGLLTKSYSVFQIDDNRGEGKLPGSEIIVAESYVCETKIQSAKIKAWAQQWFAQGMPLPFSTPPPIPNRD